MKRTDLERFLDEGLSLERIGALVGKHPSTVGYWVRKHGLEAVHGARHAPKGGIPESTLAGLVAQGLPARAIAERLAVSVTTVRYWLKRYGLATERARVRRTPLDQRPREISRRCRLHGDTRHVLTSGGRRYRCARCQADAVVRQRRRVKLQLIEEAGGRCQLCGYDRTPVALQFHHLDRSTKSFSISREGAYIAFQRVREEAKKCALLCANCHAEVEAGFIELPVGAL